jgi:hypothetical protein
MSPIHHLKLIEASGTVGFRDLIDTLFQLLEIGFRDWNFSVVLDEPGTYARTKEAKVAGTKRPASVDILDSDCPVSWR